MNSWRGNTKLPRFFAITLGNMHIISGYNCVEC